MFRPDRSLFAVLVLLGTALLPGAQENGLAPPDAEDPPGCSCVGQGADCLFGSSRPCAVTDCPPPGSCRCVGGSCFLGFPRSPRCECNFPLPEPVLTDAVEAHLGR